jgi:hypothetical protein
MLQSPAPSHSGGRAGLSDALTLKPELRPSIVGLCFYKEIKIKFKNIKTK